MKKYKITCLKCDRSNEATITEARKGEFVIDLNSYHRRNPDSICIISGRYRGDMQFGWECTCGNTSIIARTEKSDIGSLLINGGAEAIKHIKMSLIETDEEKFSMDEM